MRLRPCLLLLLLAACDNTDHSYGGDVADTGLGRPAGDGIVRVASIGDVFRNPESVRYDPDQDVYFVSNMYGYGSAKDGNGYISRMGAADPSRVDILAQGGKGGVTLDAPKGMAIQGDTLWVADIDALRGFDRHTGAPVATIDFTPFHAVQLNDVAVGPDATIRVTDTGIDMTEYGVIYHPGTDKLFVVRPGHAVSVLAAGQGLGRPNGITWDSTAKRWLLVNFDDFTSHVWAMAPGDTARTVLATGKGRFDGVEVLAGGRILYTCWNDSSVHLLDHGKDTQLIRGLPVPADLGVDTKRGRVAIPMSQAERVEIYTLPKGGG